MGNFANIVKHYFSLIMPKSEYNKVAMRYAISYLERLLEPDDGEERMPPKERAGALKPKLKQKNNKLHKT